MNLLDINDMQVLKVIRVQDNSKWTYFAGNLHYTRKMTPNYQSINSDFIDDMIFNSIKKVYPDSRLIVNKDIIWEGQMKDILNAYSGVEDISFKMSFIPMVPYDKMTEIYNMDIYIYTKEFYINRVSIIEKEKLKFMNNHMHADIPFDKIVDFNKKIKTINFKK